MPAGSAQGLARLRLVAVKIRPANAGETEALSALAMAAKRHSGYSPETLASWKDQLRISEGDLASKQVFVGCEGERLVGFYALATGKRSWTLDHLWVSPDFMQRGFGRELLAHALALAARAGPRRVTVDADPNAVAFYLKCGATQYGEIAAPIDGEPKRVRPQLAFAGFSGR